VAPLAHLPDGLSAKGFRDFGIAKMLSATFPDFAILTG
jgi:hypothetical protein